MGHAKLGRDVLAEVNVVRQQVTLHQFHAYLPVRLPRDRPELCAKRTASLRKGVLFACTLEFGFSFCPARRCANRFYALAEARKRRRITRMLFIPHGLKPPSHQHGLKRFTTKRMVAGTTAKLYYSDTEYLNTLRFVSYRST